MKNIEQIIAIEKEIGQLASGFENYQLSPTETRSEQIANLIRQRVKGLPEKESLRIIGEFEGMGPLAEPMADPQITEILVNGPDQIFIEKNGCLELYPDRFASRLSYLNFCYRLMEEARVIMTNEVPVAQGQLRNFRLHMIGAEITQSFVHICLRRHPENPWTFHKLGEANWGTEEQRRALEKIVKSQMNFLVVGSTGSGKTSVLNACLQSLGKSERCVLIEDTLELKIPNAASMRLLTREDPNGILRKIDQSDLVKNSLRLRPDRLVMGEVRGEEAKDFLMALSTGHAGSFGSLHAASAAQALIRLEMLIQLGAPHWSLNAVRRLIQMSLQAIVVIGRKNDGQRFLEGIYRLTSLEDSGVLLEKVN